MLLQVLMVLPFTLAGQATLSSDQTETAVDSDRPKAAESLTALDSKTVTSDVTPDDTAMWLVNLARHQGHLIGRTDPRRASLHVLSLLGAATEVSRDCSQAYYWLYDLEQRLGRADAAAVALSRYVQMTPDDDTAQIRHLELELLVRQTAEARAEYVKTELMQKPLSRAYESELHRWLAKFYFERREKEYAAREVEHALRLNPMNVAARELAYDMFGETEPALQHVEMALQLIAMNPSQANLIWDLADFLAGLSLHTQAQEWYRRAIEIHRRSSPGSIPAAFWHKLALSCTSSEDYAGAKEAADEALKVDPSFHAARLLRANTKSKLGMDEAAEEDVSFVSKAYEARVENVIKDKVETEAAQIAWFYSYHQPDKDKALALAKIAMDVPEPSLLARLAYGYALRLNGRTDEAIPILSSLAPVDQLAALELAKAQIEQGNRAQAMTTLHKAATVRYSGIAYNLIRELLTKYGENAAQPPLHTKVTATLDKFQRDVFDFHKRPGDYLKFTLRFVQDPLPAVGPLDAVFRLENTGPFTITLGEGFMCRPLVAVSVQIEGPQGVPGKECTVFNNYLQVLMNSRVMLQPGEAVEKTVAIDVGPMRERLIRTVSQTMNMEVTAMFDPVYENGKLTAGMGTVAAEPVQAMRPGVDISPQGMTTLLNRANSPSTSERIAAADVLGALLADAEYRLPGSRADGLPVDTINMTLAALVSDTDWQVRSHAMASIGWSRLDSRVTVAAAPSVRREENAVVKLLAVRLFAQQHGENFIQVLEQLSKTDPNRSVRIMAESFLPAPTHAQANRAVSRSDEPSP